MKATTLSHFYSKAKPTDLHDPEKLISDVVKAHFTARREGLLALDDSNEYVPELVFFFNKMDMPRDTFDEISYIKLSQVSHHPETLTKYLVGYRACRGIMQMQDIYELIEILRVILRKEELDLDLEREMGEEIDAGLWKGEQVLRFSDLLKVQDRHLQMLMREVLWQDTAAAFSRTNKELRDRMLKNCSLRVRSDLKVRMYIGGNEEKCLSAQEEWLEIFAKLIDSGEIEIP